MTKVFNSSLELGLRALMVLTKASRPLSTNEILYYDFITTYGAYFGISDYNLHGNSRYSFGEIAARRTSIKYALKRCGIDGFAIPIYSARLGFQYKISQRGTGLIESLDSNYKDEYIQALSVALELYSTLSERKLLALIKEKSLIESPED